MRLTCANASEIDSERGAPFKAVLLYEDVATGVRAKRVLDFIVGQLGPVFTFDTALWNVSEVEIGTLSSVAADQAAAAEVVVVSMRDGGGLTSFLRIWINRWIMRRRGEHSAMIVLFESPGPDTDFARRHLRNAARRARMEFFTQTGDITEEDIHPEILSLAG